MNEILATILEHHKQHLSQISQFTRTGYSFEEWLNWQAYWACSQKKGWKSSPKPEYNAVGFKTSKSQADLLVEITGQAKAIIEFGLVHDWTQSHWRDKLEADRKKLKPPFAEGFLPVQVVYVTSRTDFRQLDDWTRWLNKISFWNQPAILNAATPFPDGGIFLMKAWSLKT